MCGYLITWLHFWKYHLERAFEDNQSEMISEEASIWLKEEKSRFCQGTYEKPIGGYYFYFSW